MKFNWGTGIAIFYATFVIVLVYFVIKSTTHDNSLVVDNYYEEDLKYQSHYQKLANAQSGNVIVINKIAERQIVLQFPEDQEQITGKVLFFRPSNSNLDFSIPLQLNDQSIQNIPIQALATGLWRIKIDWSANGKDYYKEERIVL
jgi:hypothetical protein